MLLLLYFLSTACQVISFVMFLSVTNIWVFFYRPSALIAATTCTSGGVMAHRFLDRLKRSLLKDQLVGIQRVEGEGDIARKEEEELNDNRWEAELAEDECVTDRLVGTLCFSSEVGEAEVVDGDEGEESEPDSDSDFQSESVEEGLSSTGDTPLSLYVLTF